MEQEPSRVAQHGNGKRVLVLGVLGVMMTMNLVATVFAARQHYRYADAERVQATVVRAEYWDTAREKSKLIVLTLADGREVTPLSEFGGYEPSRLEPGEVRTVLINPHRPSVVVFPEQVGWWSVLVPWGLVTVGAAVVAVALPLYTKYGHHLPMTALRLALQWRRM
ncbi:hypothetical protein [Kitasatospora terrestris]|uniref:DUF3592 domain-containing protein n=1 Tax=Kitasatospora terrestris TaxID=258051 RepID=A0ABP9EMF5_9ACTN